ncbi:MAG: 6,7-dimethyl-8-ribityllumazine synthase [Limnochordaceae bacterium]|nr:6,7-dimethyl-8-ribityllumazine synthase [Limnochordaceae bacterium]
MATFEGHLDAAGLRFGIVVARFNEFITARLLEGARDALLRHGASEDAIDVAWVPGSFEIGPAALRMAQTGRYDALVCLGAVIRGATPHFEFVAQQTSRAIGELGLRLDIPVIYGVLTADTLEQAIERAGTKAGNRGFDAAVAAIEMARLYRALQAPPGRATVQA